MTQKLKKLSIISLLLSAFVIFSCSEDYEVHDHNHNESKIKVKPITIQDVSTNARALEKLTNPKSRFKTNSSMDRIINDTINNFSIDTDYGLYIEEGDYHSYTFKITRPNGSNYLLENVVVSKKNETKYETILYQYNITEQELDMIDNGDFVNLEGKMNKIFLENSIITSEVTGKYYFNGSCYEDNPVYVAGNTCPSGLHDLNFILSNMGSDDQCEYYLNGTYTATAGHWTWQSTLVPCDDAGGGGVGGTSSNNHGQLGAGAGGSVTTSPITGSMEYQIVKNFRKQLNTAQIAWWTNPNNADAIQSISDYLIQVDADEDFAEWSINFMINNPNVTWQQFQNWFMTPREGNDFEYDADFWESPTLSFPQQDLPSWSDFSNAYPTSQGSQLVITIGGDVQTAYNQYPTLQRGYCALKVSRALNYSGINIPQITTTSGNPGTIQGGDGKYYFVNAKALNKWMRETFGTNPVTSSTPFNANHVHIDGSEGGTNGGNYPFLTSGIKGIYSMVSTDPNWASGHADIINEGTCLAACHFYDYPPAPIDYIDIWILE